MELLIRVKTAEDEIELNLENAGIELEYLLPFSLYNCCVSASDIGKNFFSYCENKLYSADSVDALVGFFFEESPYEFSDEKIEELNEESFDEDFSQEIIDDLKGFFDQLNEINDFSDVISITIETSDDCDDPCKNNMFSVSYIVESKSLNTEEHYYIDGEETTAEEYVECI